MSVVHAAAVGSFGVGVVVVLVSAVAMLRAGRPEDRLHFLTPTTSLGTPLVGLGLALEYGWSLPTAEVVLTCAVVTVTGPVLASAVLRVSAQREGSVPRESPE